MSTQASINVVRLAQRIVSPKTTKCELPSLFLKLAAALEKTPSELLRQNTPRVLAAAPLPTPTPNQEEKIPSSFRKLLESSQTSLERIRTEQNQSNACSTTLGSHNSSYGETPPESIRALLSHIQETHNDSSSTSSDCSSSSNTAIGDRAFAGNFVDIGSGNGAAVVYAAMAGQFRGRICRGIEYEPTRHEEAMLLKAAYDKNNQDTSHECNITEVEFTSGDVRRQKGYFDDASILFANSPTWDAHLCGAVGQLLDEASLASPKIVISISRRFPSPTFHLVDMLSMPCNGGGDFTFYVSQKVKDNYCARDHIQHPVYALSDSPHITQLMEEEGGDMMEALLVASMVGNSQEQMALLATLGTSESCTRLMLRQHNLLPFLAAQLGKDSTLVCRARSTMVLRAISNFPVGRRSIAESEVLVDALFASLSTNHGNGTTTDFKEQTNDHPAIRANVLDVMGQMLNDQAGHRVLNLRGIDEMLEDQISVACCQNWQDVIEASTEVQVMQRWWLGEQRNVPQSDHVDS